MKNAKLMKGISVIAALIMTASACMTAVSADFEEASELTAAVSLQSRGATAGETVEIPLVMHSDNQCTTFDVLVEYDSRLEFVESQGAKAYGYEENGKKLVSLTSYGIEAFEDDTEIASITFNVPENAEIGETYSVDFASVSTLSTSFQEIVGYTLSGAVVTVVNASNKTEKTTESSNRSNPSNNAVILKDQKASAGSIVDVPLVIYSGNQCTSYDVLVEYDSRLDFVKPEGAKAYYNFEENGKKYLSLTSFETTPYKDGETAVTIKLSVPADAENDIYDVKLERVTTLSTDYEDITNFRTENAYVTVTGGTEKKTSASLEMRNVAGMAGDIAIVELFANSNNKCTNYEAVIEYDSRLSLKDAIGTDSFTKYEEDGKAYAVISGSANGTFNDSESIASLVFRIPDNATSNDSFKVSFNKVNSFSCSYGEFEDYTTSNAVVSVFESARPDDKFKDYKIFKKYDADGNLIAWRIGPRGDANGDGTLNIRDAAAIAIHCAGLYLGKRNVDDEGEFFGDTNEDGVLNIRDAAVIARYLAKGTKSWDDVL